MSDSFFGGFILISGGMSLLIALLGVIFLSLLGGLRNSLSLKTLSGIFIKFFDLELGGPAA